MIRRLLARLRSRWLATALVSRAPERSVRTVPETLGQETRRYMEALHDRLSDEEWVDLLALGHDEGTLSELRDALRPVARGTGRLASSATATRAEIDAFLSAETGMLMGSLRAYPARALAVARASTQRTRAVCRRLSTAAEQILQTAPHVERLSAHLALLQSCFAPSLPAAWDRVGGDTLQARVADLHSVEAAERFGIRVRDLEVSLEQQRAQVVATLATLRQSARECGVIALDDIIGGVNLEGDMIALREALRQHALAHAVQLTDVTVSAADAHLAHLGTARSADFVRPPIARTILPKHVVLRRWSELHAVRRRPNNKESPANRSKQSSRSRRKGGQ